VRGTALAWAVAGLVACSEPSTPPVADDPCAEASELVGELACVHLIPDRATWDAIARPTEAVDQVAMTKWLAPYTDEAVLQVPLFLAMDAFELHWELLANGFPDQFPGMDHVTYSAMVVNPDVKEYSSGNLWEFADGTWGFSVWDGRVAYNTVSRAQVVAIHAMLSERVLLAPLAFVPNTQLQVDAAASWTDLSFEVRQADESIVYEVYTPGVGYGVVKLYSPEELIAAEEQVDFGPHDILALDEAPFDIERPIAGAVTGTRQGELSHLNVRSAARGTPNCYVPDPRSVFAEWEGQLVRIDCGPTRLRIDPADLDDAEAFWAEQRPEPVPVVPADRATDTLMPLLELPTATAAERRAAVAAYGSKGANLATLYQRIDPALQLEGFLLPMAFYDQHLAQDDLQAEVLRIAADEALQLDGAARREALQALADRIEALPIDPALVSLVADQIAATFGGHDTMVRFRSSSNAEDALAFSGAGLYDSTSVCAADSLDADTLGPSRCDPDEPDERTIERGLRKVWSSAVGVAAWEERSWYGIPHDDVAMGILVNTRSKDERVNAVAFTGNPVADDDRLLLNAQVGWLDVVSAEAGVYPEQILVDVDGDDLELIRARASSEAEEVLDDAGALALARALLDIEAVMPIDEAVPDDRTLLLDTEWKVLADGRLVVKQVRPFLR